MNKNVSKRKVTFRVAFSDQQKKKANKELKFSFEKYSQKRQSILFLIQSYNSLMA